MKCCTKYDEEKCLKGYVLFPCFKVEICKNCNEVKMVCNNFLCRVFEIFVAPFWHGKIIINEKM